MSNTTQIKLTLRPVPNRADHPFIHIVWPPDTANSMDLLAVSLPSDSTTVLLGSPMDGITLQAMARNASHAFGYRRNLQDLYEEAFLAGFRTGLVFAVNSTQKDTEVGG